MKRLLASLLLLTGCLSGLGATQNITTTNLKDLPQITVIFLTNQVVLLSNGVARLAPLSAISNLIAASSGGISAATVSNIVNAAQVWMNDVNLSSAQGRHDIVAYPNNPTNLILIQRALTIGTNTPNYWDWAGVDGESIVAIHDENDTANGEFFNEFVFGFRISTNSSFKLLDYYARDIGNTLHLKCNDANGILQNDLSFENYDDGSGFVNLTTTNGTVFSLDSVNGHGRIELQDLDGIHNHSTLLSTDGGSLVVYPQGFTATGMSHLAGVTNAGVIDTSGLISAYNGVATLLHNTSTNTLITVGSSPFNFTNTASQTIVLYLDANGATTTAALNGQTIFKSLVAGDHTIVLKPSAYTTVTYSLATPIMTWTEL